MFAALAFKTVQICVFFDMYCVDREAWLYTAKENIRHMAAT